MSPAKPSSHLPSIWLTKDDTAILTTGLLNVNFLTLCPSYYQEGLLLISELVSCLIAVDDLTSSCYFAR